MIECPEMVGYRPDLNLIEDAWSMLEWKICRRSRFLMCTTELFKVLQEWWVSIPNSYFTRLMQPMATRVSFVELNKSNPFASDLTDNAWRQYHWSRNRKIVRQSYKFVEYESI